MSYKKIVAGVATFAVASAMVVPAAFAADPVVDVTVDGKSMDLDDAKDYVARADEFNKLQKDAVKQAEGLLKKLAKFNDRTLEVKVGDYLFNNQNVVASLEAQLAKVKGMKYSENAMNELKMAIKWLNQMEKYVNAFMATDPAAMKEVSGKKAATKAAKAEGKKLPKTADAAPVAPVAAVAGSAALIAAGLVASRKVNA